jgi:hypothetical protein
MKLKSILKKGDLITHTVCMGELQEHIFTGFDGQWICGKPTKLTKKYGTCVSKFANDIHPENVTHVNRIPPECIEFLS